MNDENPSLDTLIPIFHRMHHGCMRQALEEKGLQEIANPGILFMLHHATFQFGQQGLSQKEIADMMGVAPPTVAVSIKRMERAELVRKEPDEGDLRKNRITFTPKGLALTKECLEVEQAIYRRIISGLSHDEVEILCDLYHRMIDNMRGLGVRRPHYKATRRNI